MTTEHNVANNLKMIRELVYNPCGLVLANLMMNDESVEYGACSYDLNRLSIVHRVSKITPTKTGQFVTLWKRDMNGTTAPFDMSDNIDFVVIVSKSENNTGLFIFPKSVLIEKGIFSQKDKSGKRGIRVYPSWDIVTSKQAEKTQRWQTDYFFSIKGDNNSCIDFARKFLKGNRDQLFVNLNEIYR